MPNSPREMKKLIGALFLLAALGFGGWYLSLRRPFGRRSYISNGARAGDAIGNFPGPVVLRDAILSGYQALGLTPPSAEKLEATGIECFIVKSIDHSMNRGKLVEVPYCSLEIQAHRVQIDAVRAPAVRDLILQAMSDQHVARAQQIGPHAKLRVDRVEVIQPSGQSNPVPQAKLYFAAPAVK